MKFGILVLLFISFASSAPAQDQGLDERSVASVGLPTGEQAPGFHLTDQFGHEQSNGTLKGLSGTVLLFFRSADWWPFCKAQLVQLQNAKPRFEARGIKLAAISYDGPAILKDFATRHNIDIPLLADPDSRVIRSFRVLNSQAKGMTAGMAYPGFFFIDSTGIIRDKFFEAKYTERFTPGSVLSKLFPELTEEVTQNVEAPHLHLALGQSDTAIVSGRVTLSVEIELPPEVHVYAPGVTGYKPIQLVLREPNGIQIKPPMYPNHKTLYLEAIKEQVPVFDGKFRITEDLTVPFSKFRDGLRTVFGGEKELSITGDLLYQACDKTTCYPPTSVPVKWKLRLIPPDLKRSPGNIQHKSS